MLKLEVKFIFFTFLIIVNNSILLVVNEKIKEFRKKDCCDYGFTLSFLGAYMMYIIRYETSITHPIQLIVIIKRALVFRKP
jgi:hypothetical protein